MTIRAVISGGFTPNTTMSIVMYEQSLDRIVMCSVPPVAPAVRPSWSSQQAGVSSTPECQGWRPEWHVVCNQRGSRSASFPHSRATNIQTCSLDKLRTIHYNVQSCHTCKTRYCATPTNNTHTNKFTHKHTSTQAHKHTPQKPEPDINNYHGNSQSFIDIKRCNKP